MRVHGRGEPGQVVPLPGGGEPAVAVVTGQGLLGLVRVQLEGRKPQTGEEFIRGYPQFLKARLPS